MGGNADEKEMTGGRRWLLLGMACVCTMLTFLNMGCITAATPDLSGTFVVGTLDVSWSGAACPLGTALSFTVAAYLWARLGLRRSLRTALLLMLAGTLAGLAADHFFIMVLARFLQGTGGGLALVYGTGLVNAALPPERRSPAMGVKLCSIGLASCASPVAGCLLVQYWHWKGLFVIVGAAAALLAVLTTLYVPNTKIPKNGKFDWFSFLALAAGCVCILMVLIYGETDGWTAPGVLCWMYGGFCSLVLAAISCMTHRTPLLDVRVLGNWRFLFGLLASLCNIFCICWVRVGTVQFMRNVMNYEPAGIAWVFLVLVAGFCAGAAIVLPLMQKGRLALRVGMMAGLLGLGSSAFFLSRLDAGRSWLDVAWPLGLLGVGYAFCLNVATPLALRGVEAKSAAASSRTLNTVRYVFISMYVGSVSTVLAHMKKGYRFDMAEQVRDDSPGTVQTLDMWQRHFSETGGTAADIHASVNAMLNHAVALQSQIFSVDAFYLCTVIVGGAGVLFALLCLKSGKERNTAS